MLACSAFGQVWSGSGSNGSDGALNLGANTPGVVAGVLIFDPVALNLDADADNVFHFTTITIRDNINVRFLASKTRRPGPVVFLASGAVTVGGRLDFSGEDGHVATNNDSLRRISIPGPGGYPGGVGAKLSGTPPTPGLGPGGGRVIASSDLNFFRGCPGAYTNPIIPGWCTTVGAPPSYGTNLLQPLVGGSGGSGGWGGRAPLGGSGGGAGGGAFRLSSSVSIAFGSGLSGTTAQGCNGSFHFVIADGGGGGSIPNDGQWTGAGAGGAVHLQAPIIAGCGTHVYARGGAMNLSAGSEGRIRLDANNNVGISTSPPGTTNQLVDAPLPPNQPFLKILSINGVNVPTNPKFDYASPDVLINSTTPVPVAIEANNIPVNTPVTLFFTTDTGADIVATVNLTGTVATSNATVNVTLPLGTARLIARAVW
jgi:hypothetical protein